MSDELRRLLGGLEALVLSKLLADRAHDRADVEAILDAASDSLDTELLAAEASDLEIVLPDRLRRT